MTFQLPLSADVAHGQTTIAAESSISEDTIWRISGSPYLIEGLVTVEEGATLTIEPGVEIIYEFSALTIKCYGRIEAVGTPTGRISVSERVIEGAQPTGFIVESTGHLDASYCDFSNLGYGICFFQVNHSNVTDCTFASIRDGAIMVNGMCDNIAIKGNQFTDNGIRLDGYYFPEHPGHVFEGNTVNGKPIYYYQDASGVNVPADAGAIMMYNCTDVTLDGLDVTGAVGIWAQDLNRMTISNCNVSDTKWCGLWLLGIDNLTVENCEIWNNTGFEGGIFLMNTANSTVRDCLFAGNSQGLGFSRDRYLTVENNAFLNDGMNINGLESEDFAGISLEGNTANGKPIYVYEDVSAVSVPQDAGAIIMVNCTDSLIEGFNISNAGYGIQLAWSQNITVNECEFFSDVAPVSLITVTYSRITNSTVMNCERALVMWASDHNTITMNEFCGKGNLLWTSFYEMQAGLSLDQCRYNNISCNNITYMGYALSMYGSDNIIYHNNIMNYSQNYPDSSNRFSADYPAGGNYWDKHEGTDVKWGSPQTRPGSDGMGDDPFAIDFQYPDVFDDFPLMHPFAWWGEVAPSVDLISPITPLISPGTNLEFDIWDGNLDLASAFRSINAGDFEDMRLVPVIATDGWADGTYTIDILANDTAGHCTHSTHTFTVDTTGPSVVSTYPASGALDVPLDAVVYINFSERVDPASCIVNTNPAAPLSTLSWSASWNNATLRFSGSLWPDILYTITVDNCTRDVAGNEMVGDFVLGFTTLDTAPADSDGDGTPDAQDAFPDDANETMDNDDDGIGDNADEDDDGDGIPDTDDPAPLEPSEADADSYGLAAAVIVAFILICILLTFLALRRKKAG